MEIGLIVLLASIRQAMPPSFAVLASNSILVARYA